MEELERLQRWYTAQCDGEWEHDRGVRIETLDNPGWLLSVDVTGTPLAGRPFAELAEGVGEDGHPREARWIHCTLRDSSWRGAGDPSQLGRLLRVFLDWAGA
jgi:hypothetical protein